MRITGLDFQSIAEAAEYLQLLQMEARHGERNVSAVGAVLDAIDMMECRSIADAMALIDLSQQISAALFFELRGNVDGPGEGEDQTAQLAGIMRYLSRCREGLTELGDQAPPHSVTIN
ncbi:hypothetical protein [Aliirhizobium smilacinae]|uniref:Uncharacterized protein n=1 Tax=Aliirhizobium smilacinae TaxID=1395944 RepID=A0A5C4XSX9_9HYPH|nr:hypothetical protein [Rhizobium smilacinae]TNM66479.1 hypothetical protein FHP24_09855 [Rhizobium smilacinae]